MRIVKFEIANFKGINKTSIHLSDEIPGNVVTLIGLNESGKTTILEALSHFITEDQETASLVGTVHRKSSAQDLIPKHRKAAFTGAASIEATIVVSDEDIEALSRFYEEQGLILSKSKFPRTIVVTRNYEFEDSAKKAVRTLWTVSIEVRPKRAKNVRPAAREEWLKGIEFLSGLIPRMIYFPTFLFNFPDRIYLEDGQGEGPNDYYKQVIQDVLNHQGDQLSVQKHIVDRIRTHREGYTNPAAFLAFLWGQDEKSQIDAVMHKISNEMSKVIFGAWSDILERNVQNKRVHVEWNLDSERGNTPYLQVWIIDGQSRYALSERSLGFRWFFSFLLFTQFRKNRDTGKGTIFLFDEPASNLHSRAQIKLLDSFSKIAGGATFIIYSTHSHYMVNPLWLEKAYIIENAAIDYEDDQGDAFSLKKTEINAIKYRHFVALNPTKTTYFQPVLDALKVSFSPLERSSRALIVEGKFDFHPFVYLRAKIPHSAIPQIFPANGAGGVGNLINLFRGWGVDFRMMLDDDKAGREAKKKYSKEYLMPLEHIATLGDIRADFSGKVFEDIYQDDVKGAASKYFGMAEKDIGKRQFSIFFQELIATGAMTQFPKTQAMFKTISDWVDDAFGMQNGKKVDD